MEGNKIFELMKNEVLTILPDSKILLFGSRANGYANEESDWDILILTPDKPDNKTKTLIQNKLFPISVQVAAFINIVLVSEDDWNTNPSYYALHQSILLKKVMA